MNSPPSLDELWDSAPSAQQFFDPSFKPELPEGAQRYFGHAIAAGAPLASAVRLRMHGEIKLKKWCAFSAEQVILLDRGMIWRATARIHGISIRGSDSIVDGQGAMHWKLFGLVPVMDASGPDITRSAAGRANIESLWLPSTLYRDEVSWTASDACHLHAGFTAHNETAEIDYVIDSKGKLQSVSMPRWGNPGGGAFRYVSFGSFVEQEGTFNGYTIPSKIRVGWYFGSERFEREGEFFRATIDEAEFR